MLSTAQMWERWFPIGTAPSKEESISLLCGDGYWPGSKIIRLTFFKILKLYLTIEIVYIHKVPTVYVIAIHFQVEGYNNYK